MAVKRNEQKGSFVFCTKSLYIALASLYEYFAGETKSGGLFLQKSCISGNKEHIIRFYRNPACIYLVLVSVSRLVMHIMHQSVPAVMLVMFAFPSNSMYQKKSGVDAERRRSENVAWQDDNELVILAGL